MTFTATVIRARRASRLTVLDPRSGASDERSRPAAGDPVTSSAELTSPTCCPTRGAGAAQGRDPTETRPRSRVRSSAETLQTRLRLFDLDVLSWGGIGGPRSGDGTPPRPRVARRTPRREDGSQDRVHLPLARRADPRHATFATLLMSTGLTFGNFVAVWAQRRHHRQDAVFASRHGRRSVRSDTDRDRRTLVPARRRA